MSWWNWGSEGREHRREQQRQLERLTAETEALVALQQDDTISSGERLKLLQDGSPLAPRLAAFYARRAERGTDD